MHSFGLEMLYQKNRLIAHAEAILPRHEGLDSTIDPDGDPLLEPNGDFQTSLGYYSLVGYEVGRVTPFALMGVFDGDLSASDDKRREFVVGLNFAFAPRVRLKGQVQHMRYDEGLNRANQTTFSTQVAVAF